MRLIVDANVIFSGILNTQGKIGNIILNSGNKLTLLAPDYLRIEIFRLEDKLLRVSGMTAYELREVESLLFSNVRFISPLQIKQQYWAKSEKLVSKIDANDIPYIAYAYQFRCRLWSGDLVLKKGLERLGNNKVISTNEVAAFLEQTNGAKRK